LEYVQIFGETLQNILITNTSIVINLIIAVLIFFFFLVAKKFFTEIIFKFILKAFSQTQLEFAEKFLCSFKRPIEVFFVILGLYLALAFLPLSLENQILISKLFRTILIILITWGLYDLSAVDSALFQKIQERTNLELDKVLFSFISKFCKVILILIAITIIAQEWDYDINGLIAGLGLGGLAFALAAQDSLSNIFGGIIIILDKPFSVGDWIKTPSVEGTVEALGFRSAKIRTFAHALVTVPNATLAKEAIINWSKMGKRRATFELRIALNTPKEKIEKAVFEIKTMLKNHPGVHQDTIFVNLESIGEDSLNIILYFFTITIVWGEFIQVKEDVNYKILQILEEEGINIALPSRRVYHENFRKTKSAFEE